MSDNYGYYSKILNKPFDTLEELKEAEKKYNDEKKKAEDAKAKLLAERKLKADAIESARKAMIEARKEAITKQNEYKALVDNFIKKYGTYHYSTSNVDDFPSLVDFLGDIFHPFL